MLDHPAMQSDFQKLRPTKKHLYNEFPKDSLRSCWLYGRTTWPKFWKMANHQWSPALSRLVGLGFSLGQKFIPIGRSLRSRSVIRRSGIPERWVRYEPLPQFGMFFCHEGLMIDKLFVYFLCAQNLHSATRPNHLRPQHIRSRGLKMIYWFDMIWRNPFGWY